MLAGTQLAVGLQVVDRPRQDDGSPARLIAAMVGIVGILLLGSLAWSAVGALFNALGEVTASLTSARPTPNRLTGIVGTATITSARATAVPPTLGAAPTVTLVVAPAATEAPTSAPSPTLVATAQPTAEPSATPKPSAGTPTPVADGRVPWILLPQPVPGGRVAPGNTTIEARGRGDAPIKSMRLELDGAALPGAFEQRDSATWRVSATTRVAAGQHAVRAVIVDERGRTGGFRWNFEAAP